jgi:hypothetical protein
MGVLASMVAGIVTVGGARADGPRKMRTFDTPHYMLTTDIPDAYAREADLRMTRIFEEYTRRTASFANSFSGKFPFFMYENREDYYKAGGLPGSDGVFGGGKLMAIAGEKANPEVWHIVQHEGFHQFAAMTIRARLPVWLNEGLAEFFGEAIWTGDNFVSGYIPPYRLKLVKKAIRAKEWKFADMMAMSNEEWNANLTFENYTQAWAMTHFLAKGDNEKYQRAFSEYINQMNKGASPKDAWAHVFGQDVKGFQERCEKWWLALPDDPTADLLEKAEVQALTSILARAELQGQKYGDFDEFLAKARPTDLKLNRDMWLPPEFVEMAVKRAPRVGTWTLEAPKVKGQMPKLTCVSKGGERYVGAFVLQGRRVGQVGVTLEKETGKSAVKGR